MLVKDIAGYLESIAPLSLQEDYDNAGLLLGNPEWECTGILCTLDVTEQVVLEAVARQCNCIMAHHPLIFRGLKKITGNTPEEKAVIAAIKNDIAIYASHTNLDNIIAGVNARIADRIGLTDRRVLDPKRGVLKKLITFVPVAHLEHVRQALFEAGAGHVGNYSECSFSHPGTGTFKPGEGTAPFSGEQGQRKNEDEVRLEVVLHAHLRERVVAALEKSHPYEEVAYDLVDLANRHQGTGAGIIGTISGMSEASFLSHLKDRFALDVIKHTVLTGRPVKTVAVCGGAGSFLIARGLAAKADAYITSDIKYHEFFAATDNLLLCDIGHFESEQFTVDLFIDILEQKFPTFAVLKSEVKTNPVRYFTGK